MVIRLVSVTFGDLMGVLTVLFCVSVVYALLLEITERRLGFVTAYGWLASVIGAAYTLAGVALLSLEAAVLCLLAFVAAGVPIVGRSILRDVAERKGRLDHLEWRGHD